MNIGIARTQLCVMALHHANTVPQPLANLEDRLAGAGEDRRERVPHDVRRDPRAILLLHVFGKRTPEIVSVSPESLTDFRHQGEVVSLFALQISFQEFLKWSSQRNAALLAVFRSKSRGLANVQRAAVEPVHARLVNLAAAQTGVEAAIKNESQIIRFRVGDQFVFLLFGAESESAFRFVSRQHDFGNRIIDASPLNLDCPSEETAERHHVALRGGLRDARLEAAVKALDMFSVHTARRERNGHTGGELAQRNELHGGALARILVHAEFVGNEPINFVPQILVRRDERISGDFRCFTDRFAQIASVEIDPFSDPADLSSEPVRAAFQVEILHRSQNLFTDRLSETRQISVNPANRSCAVQGLNLRPLPCQGSCVHRSVHRKAFTNNNLSVPVCKT